MSSIPQVADSNPLYAFRAPKRIPRRHAPVADYASGKHFVPSRTDLVNSRSPMNVFPGDLTYKNDPSLELDFGLWEDKGTSKSASEGVGMTMFGLYKEAMAVDFIIAERVRMAWKPDAAGRLTFAGLSSGIAGTEAMVLMWRTGEEADAVAASSPQRQESDNIQTSVEQKMAERTAQYAATADNDDIRFSVKYTDDRSQMAEVDSDEGDEE